MLKLVAGQDCVLSGSYLHHLGVAYVQRLGAAAVQILHDQLEHRAAFSKTATEPKRSLRCLKNLL